ncbi:COG3650 family protein [Vibrio ostreicida]|uniref:Lipoprotein n=1 Tax=Vibrio ostreicida TaxID=526588 RepID=A0ABT8BRN0_9VIBR|nr:hypothetical protein [Vibrio ostreicida]MDN3608770.1 hypothetical protein [Vibrio ostreicida]NPD10796.1 hypothetical protein [Vibrio ostreicida]
MKVTRNPAALVSLLALQACTNLGSSPDKQAAHVSLHQPSSIKPQTFILRGNVVIGQEARSITPCGSQQQYWLDLPEDRFKQSLKLVRSPYSPLYGELVGHLDAPPQDGLASDYAARFVVDKINVLTAEASNQCSKPIETTRAFGTEPFWSVRFTPNSLKFSVLGQDEQRFEILSRKIEIQRRRYTLSHGDLELNHRSCSDGMSDSLYGWRATLTVNGKVYKGCATLSNQDTTLHWASTYHAKARQNVPFSVALTMRPDHTARTTYRYQNGEADTVERGFWQQLNQDQVQIVGTHLQNQPLNSERIYTRENQALTAHEERVGSVVYDISEGGLSLFKQEQAATESPSIRNDNKIPSSAEFNPKVDSALRDYFKQAGIEPTGIRYRWLTYELNDQDGKALLVQLDWCGSGGCTLLVFANQDQHWQFHSKITLVQTPLNVGKSSHESWKDLIMFVSGGGAIPSQHRLQFNGKHYPSNPSTAPRADYDDISPVQLFSDGLTPHQGGITL